MTKLWLTALLGTALLASSGRALAQESAPPRTRLTPRLKPRPDPAQRPAPPPESVQDAERRTRPQSTERPSTTEPPAAEAPTPARPPESSPATVDADSVPVASATPDALGFRPPLLPAMGRMEPPTGYVERRRLNWPLLVGGGFTFVVSYGASLVYSANNQGLGALAIPIAGPWVAMGQRNFGCEVDVDPVPNMDVDESTDEATACVVDEAKVFGVLAGVGVGQLIGSVLLTVGVLDRKKQWLRADLAVLGLEDVSLEPARTYHGLSVTGRF